MSKTLIIIPCFDEEKRLKIENLLSLLAHPNLHILLVNDGSRDKTAKLIDQLSNKHQNISAHHLEKNCGKGEAVREGLLVALKLDYSVAGYVDADFATPPDEVLRVLDLFLTGEADVAWGARVNLMSSNIQRSFHRHYLGRIFATVASLVLGVSVYDTQCGLKLFRVNKDLKSVLSSPFRSRWAFDVELIGRYCLLDTHSEKRISFTEMPLMAWQDVGGSKLTLRSALRAFWDLFFLRKHLRAWRM